MKIMQLTRSSTDGCMTHLNIQTNIVQNHNAEVDSETNGSFCS